LGKGEYCPERANVAHHHAEFNFVGSPGFNFRGHSAEALIWPLFDRYSTVSTFRFKQHDAGVEHSANIISK
jgi:hypothetical protein